VTSSPGTKGPETVPGAAEAQHTAEAQGTDGAGGTAEAQGSDEAQGTAGAPGAGAGRPWHVRGARLLRRHWLVAILLAAGLVLRALALIAYHPALIYVDTLKYLYGAYPGSVPLGYAAALRLILLAGDLGTVAAIQHLLGLAMAVALYVVLLRRGAARWLAALAVAPVLLDAYQLQIEQTIMPDSWFEALLVAGLVVLLWRPAVTVRFALAAGLILGLSATVMQIGEITVLPAIVYLLVAGGGWDRAITNAVALLAAFLLPVLCYCGVSYARTGHFWLAHRQSLVGREAAAADCATLKLPAAVRPLCPTPAEQAQGPDWLEHSGSSPLFATPLPPGAKRGKLIAELGSAVRQQQPLRMAASMARDSVRLFALTRSPTLGVTPIARWQFQDSYPTYPPWVKLGPGNVIVVGIQHQVFAPFRDRALNPSYGGPARLDRPVAAFLRSYQLDGGYTPGPLYALLALVGLAGSVLALIRRTRSPAALACLLFTATAATVLLAPDVFEFSWRYMLPAAVTLPPAGAAGITAAAGARSVLRPRGRQRAGGR
jgi:hypothetical protein